MHLISARKISTNLLELKTLPDHHNEDLVLYLLRRLNAVSKWIQIRFSEDCLTICVYI